MTRAPGGNERPFSRSQIKSSTSSRPTESRIVSGVTPAAHVLVAELLVRRGRRMDHQALRVADVGQVAPELERFDEAASGIASAAQAEGEDRARVGGCVPMRPRTRSAKEVATTRALRTWPPSATGASRRLDQQPGVHRRQRRADVAQDLGARAHQERVLAERFGEIHVMIAGARRGEQRMLPRAPVKLSGLDDHAADRRPMPADELGRGVDDDVGAPSIGRQSYG